MRHQARYRKHSDIREKKLLSLVTECPSKKVCYPTKALAWEHIAQSKKIRNVAASLHPYKCPDCKCWHMTSQEER